MNEWQPYDEGQTMGTRGTEGGTITHDEEHPAGARITLERDCARVPYAITCGVYGWMVHTRFIADEPTALKAYREMRDGLEIIASLIPDQEDPDVTHLLDEVDGEIQAFVERFT